MVREVLALLALLPSPVHGWVSVSPCGGGRALRGQLRSALRGHPSFRMM